MRSVWRRGLIRRISLATPDALCIWLASEKGARHCCTRDGLSGKWRVQKEKGFQNKAAASTTHPCKKNLVFLSRDYARWGGQENENKRSQFKTRLNSNLSNWIKKESLAFHMQAGNAPARVRKCAGSSEPWLPMWWTLILHTKTPNQLKWTILINYCVWTG